MADVLDLDQTEEFEVDDDGDRKNLNLCSQNKSGSLVLRIAWVKIYPSFLFCLFFVVSAWLGEP